MAERDRRPKPKDIPQGMYYDPRNQMIVPNGWIAVRGTSEATGRPERRTPKTGVKSRSYI